MTSPSSYTAKPAGRAFFVGLLSIALMLISVGVGAFWYLTTNSPLSLLEKNNRPIAAATAFVPANVSATFSLLTNPQKLIALQQALPGTEREQVLEESAQIKQGFFNDSPLDYDLDIQPWAGDEVTIALTDLDLDFDNTNGQQPGYLLAVEIAPERSQQARESLQLFWQRQTLAGNSPQSEQLSGVRILYSAAYSAAKRKPAPLKMATALVGNQFVLFANDLRVIRNSLRATETATNLAQNRAYRKAADALPQDRLGLAYLKTSGITGKAQGATSDFTAVAISPTPTGLMATALWQNQPEKSTDRRVTSQSRESAVDRFKFMPADSAIALTGQNINQLSSVLEAANRPLRLPEFLGLQNPVDDQKTNSPTDRLSVEDSAWRWATGEYAIAKKGKGKSGDWVLAIQRDPEGIAGLDTAAKARGYNAIPLMIGDQEAIAWTKFETRRSSSALETKILGLHLQQNGDEIFASSIAAMDDALSGASQSLLTSPLFSEAIAPIQTNRSDSPNSYLYIDWTKGSSVLTSLPILKRIEPALRPVIRQIETLAATKSGDRANIFIRFEA